MFEWRRTANEGTGCGWVARWMRGSGAWSIGRSIHRGAAACSHFLALATSALLACASAKWQCTRVAQTVPACLRLVRWTPGPALRYHREQSSWTCVPVQCTNMCTNSRCRPSAAKRGLRPPEYGCDQRRAAQLEPAGPSSRAKRDAGVAAREHHGCRRESALRLRLRRCLQPRGQLQLLREPVRCCTHAPFRRAPAAARALRRFERPAAASAARTRRHGLPDKQRADCGAAHRQVHLAAVGVCEPPPTPRRHRLRFTPTWAWGKGGVRGVVERALTPRLPSSAGAGRHDALGGPLCQPALPQAGQCGWRIVRPAASRRLARTSRRACTRMPAP